MLKKQTNIGQFLLFPPLGSNRHRNTPLQRILHLTKAVHGIPSTPGHVMASLRRPNLTTSLLLLLMVLREDFTNSLLEKQRPLLHLRVQLAIHKHTGIEVLLAVDAEVLVLGHDTLVHVADEVEVVVRGVLVAVDFVAHDALRRAGWCKPLHEEEVGGDVERGVGPEVGGGDAEALGDLVGARGAVVLDVAVFGLDVVRVQIGDCGDVGVRDLAVVALVVVVGEDLPVELALHVPGVVEDVVLEVVVFESGLLIDTVKVVFPGDFGDLFGVQVDPDEAVLVNVHVDRRGEVLVESIDDALVILGDDELEACGVVWNPVTGVGDAMLVGGEKPFPGEDGAFLKLEHLLRGVPRSRQSADRLLLFLLRDSRSRSAKEIPQERHFDGELETIVCL